MAPKKRKRRAKAARPAKRKAGKRKAAKRGKRTTKTAAKAADKAAAAAPQWPGAAAPKKRKRKASAAPAVKRVRRKRRKAARGRLEVSLAVPAEIAIDGTELEGITTSQRLELAAMGSKRKPGVVPSFIADADTWARAVRSIHSHWDRYAYPYAAALWVYQRLGGTLSTHSNHKPSARPRAQA